jgi:3-hydroxyisobutyrate dehydrogenase
LKARRPDGRGRAVEAIGQAHVLNASSGRNNTTEVKLKPFILSGKFNTGFPIGLMAKDVRTADDLGRGIGVPRPFADVCADI